MLKLKLKFFIGFTNFFLLKLKTTGIYTKKKFKRKKLVKYIAPIHNYITLLCKPITNSSLMSCELITQKK